MSQQKLGILLINLGTPEAPTPKAIRAFLRPFISDHRVIDLNPLVWFPALYGFILPIRPHKIQHLYQNIWTEEGSPLRLISYKQAELLEEELQSQGYDAMVQAAMVYGEPSLKEALVKLKKAQAERLILLPLFPQYSSTTTATGLDAFARAVYHEKGLLPFDLIHSYHDHPAYIQALANTIQLEPDEKLIFSYHGIPARYEKEGDYYPDHCLKTTELVVEKLGLSSDQWMICYQSRFGREEWLKPYTDDTLTELPKQGVTKVALICPGFAADCLETLEEIDISNREKFMQAGGESYRYIPALNSSVDHIKLLAQLITEKI